MSASRGRQPSGAVLWLTGLSGSGKSTVAYGARTMLATLGVDCAVIDGDVLRYGLCRDLGYSDEDRCENIRRAGEVALARAQAGRVAIVALISPFERARRAVEERVRQARVPFALVHVAAPLACCEQRDPKGLYRQARAGKLPNFTGVSAPYEPPENPALVLRTDVLPEQTCIEQTVDLGLKLLRRDTSCWVVL